MSYVELAKELRESAANKRLMIYAADAIEDLEFACNRYEKDYKALCEYLPKWIPVTERLPKGADESGEICENVNLLLDDGLVTCGWMNGITRKVYYLNDRDDFIIKAPISRVTHWMPLPEPPKEETE